MILIHRVINMNCSSAQLPVYPSDMCYKIKPVSLKNEVIESLVKKLLPASRNKFSVAITFLCHQNYKAECRLCFIFLECCCQINP